ncbi:MAG: hypothetical protein WC582_03805 [Patescibacteria group bacterium]
MNSPFLFNVSYKIDNLLKLLTNNHFSPFGVGIHSPRDGKIYHNGLALFGDYAWDEMMKSKKPF